jgi:ABC-type transport system substrate-binding protein/tRNA A-37 threonylcarbamoyl transferase component Bud32
MRMDVVAGTVIVGFRVESLLGEGAMGTVYLAEETASGRRVALKLLAPELATDERFRARFLRETELAASLDDPHVVPTLASGEEDGTLYLAMAYVEGADLRKLLRSEGRLEPERAIDLIGQVASALDAAHASGLVHRDVKPANILVERTDGGEKAYVCDFGLARHVTSVSSLTSDRGFVGTIDYVPPEQVEGGTVDARADVYSLGCVLFECLTGERPFDRESELSVLFAHLNDPPPRATERRPELPATFDPLFETALAKSPDERYSSCGELARAARAALAGRALAPRRTHRLRVAAAATLVLAGAVVAAVLATEAPQAHRAVAPALRLAPNALNLVDARTRRVTGHVQLADPKDFSSPIGDVALAGGSAWAVLGSAQQLVRVDLRTRRKTKVVHVPWTPGQRLAVGGGLLWMHEDLGPHVLAVDERTGKVVHQFEVAGDGIAGIAYGAGSLWLAQGSEISRVDPRTGRTLRSYPAPARWLTFADGFLWAADPGTGRVTKIDPIENKVVKRATLHPWITDIAVGGGFVWVSVTPADTVFKLGEGDLGVQGSIPAGGDPERISFGGGRLWIANSAPSAVSLFGQLSTRRTSLAAGERPTTAVYRGGLLAVAASRSPAPLRPIKGEELRISTPGEDFNYGFPDPLNAAPSSQQILYATCATLLNYPDAAGAAGTRLRPEIAAAMPTISNGGRTYTFRIRPGFRFSPPSKEPVTAETFQHSFERELSPKNGYPAGPGLASDIRGASAYMAGKSPHISGVSAHGDTLSITLVKPAGDFLTRISMSAFCPVPLSVPVHSKHYLTVPPPAAGPYYVSSVQGDRTVLLPNPNYPGSRPRKAARIVLTDDIPTDKAVALADGGAVDLLPWDFDGTSSLLMPGGVLDHREGAASAAARAGNQRFFLYNAPILDYIVLNAERPLFRDPRLRRAVNYALDRPALARAFADAPDDQIVPPAVPGFAPGRSFPVGGPDLQAARRLTGGRHHRARLYFCDSGERPVASIVRSDLRRIGITLKLDQAGGCPSSGRYDARSLRADLILVDQFREDVRDPQHFLDQALARDGSFGSALGHGLWTSRGFRRELDQARPLRGDARTIAYQRIVGQLMHAAPFAVYGSWIWSEYFSPKVGCKVFQGEYGFADLGALCKHG